MLLKITAGYVGALTSLSGFLLGTWTIGQVMASFPHSAYEAFVDILRLSTIFVLPSLFSLAGSVIIAQSRKDPAQSYKPNLFFYLTSLAVATTFLNVFTITLVPARPLILLTHIILAIVSIIILFKLADTNSPETLSSDMKQCGLYMQLNSITAMAIMVSLLSFAALRLFFGTYLLIPALIYGVALVAATLRQRTKRELMPEGFLLLWVGLGNLILGAAITMTVGIYYIPIVMILIIVGITVSIF